MIINKKFEEPFDKTPKEDELPIISQTLINSRLTPKFWKTAKKILDSNLIEDINNRENLRVKPCINKQNLKNNFSPNKQIGNNKINLNKIKKEVKSPKLENKYNINNTKKNNNNNINRKNNIRNNNLNNNIDNFENLNIDNIELNVLKEACEKLEKDLNEKEMIILKQREEKIIITEKIKKLEKMLSSFVSLDKI